jgi:hypothetical protein
MWITTCHRFANRAEFLAACQAAGWTCLPGQDPETPFGVALDVLGPIVAPAQIGEGGALIAGEVLDPRYHVNLAWHGSEPEAAFQASLVVPATPSRGWDVALPPASQLPVPPVIPAWKGLAWLEQAGLLDDAATSAEAGSPVARLAFRHAAEWHRDSPLITALAVGLGLDSAAIDAAFRAADAIRG